MSRIYKRPETRVFWIWYRELDGKIVRKSLKTTRKGVAEIKQRRIDRNLKQGKISGDPLLSSYLADFFDYKKNTVTPEHLKDLRGRLKSFTSKAENISDLTPPTIQAYINSIEGAASTIRSHKSAISAFCKYLVVHIGALSENPCVSVSVPKQKQILPRFLCDADVKKTLHLAKKHGVYLEILFALKTGFRLSELRVVLWEWIDLKIKLVTLPGKVTKTGRSRTVPLADDLLAELKIYRKNSGPVFPSPVTARSGDCGLRTLHYWLKIIKPIQDAIPAFTAGCSPHEVGRSWHRLRHTFCSRAVQAGVSLQQVMEWAGHTNFQTTLRYAHLAPNKYDSDINLV